MKLQLFISAEALRRWIQKIAALIHVGRAIAHFSLRVSTKAKTGNG